MTNEILILDGLFCMNVGIFIQILHAQAKIIAAIEQLKQEPK